MCTSVHFQPILQIAEDDIVVYKLVDVQYKRRFFGLIKSVLSIKSFFQNYEYPLGVVCKSYLDDFKKDDTLDIYRSRRAFYSWDDSYHANVKCIIPKGSKFYKCYDTYAHRVVYHSDQIKIVSIL